MDLHPSPLAQEIVQQRISVLLELANSLELAQKAVLQSNLEQFRFQTARQIELCNVLRESSVKSSEHLSSLHAGGSHSSEQSLKLGSRDPWNTLRAQLREVELRVLQLNHSYGALLQRARRTVDIFCRVLANSDLTYDPPVPRCSGMDR